MCEVAKIHSPVFSIGRERPHTVIVLCWVCSLPNRNCLYALYEYKQAVPTDIIMDNQLFGESGVKPLSLSIVYSCCIRIGAILLILTIKRYIMKVKEAVLLCIALLCVVLAMLCLCSAFVCSHSAVLIALFFVFVVGSSIIFNKLCYG